MSYWKGKAMGSIRIEWLFDNNECEQCGGSYAEGARVWLDDELILNLQPTASCYDSEWDWEKIEVFRLLLEKLGHTIRIDEAEYF